MTKENKNTLYMLFTLIIMIILFINRDYLFSIMPSYIALFGGIIVSFIVGGLVSNLFVSLFTKSNKKSVKQTHKPKQMKVNNAIKNEKYYLTTPISELSGHDFEEVCYMYFKDKGYKPERTPKSGDHGVDLLITDPKDGFEMVVQCKRYTSNNIGNRDLRDLEGAKRFYKRPGTFFITTSNYTKMAKEYAEQVNMKIWNGLQVNLYIDKWRQEKAKQL